MNKRRAFSEEFKREPVRQLELGNKSLNDIAIDLGVRRNMLYKWQAQLRKHGGSAFQGPGGKTADPGDEVARLRKELILVSGGSGHRLCENYVFGIIEHSNFLEDQCPDLSLARAGLNPPCSPKLWMNTSQKKTRFA